MNKTKYLLLFSSCGALALLATAAIQENFLREWRRVQAQGRTDEGPIPIQLRQIVNPGLRTSDRCITCHVTMAPGESEVTGSAVLTAHKPVVHDPAEWGCTICHAGQGQATDKADAHGNVPFWPDPMIAARISQAACGNCHAPLAVPSEERLQHARGAFARLDCYACHKLDGRGGTIRPDRGGMEGSDLSRVGVTGYDRGWYASHLRQHDAASDGPWRNSFSTIGEQDQALLHDCLATAVAAPKLIEAKAVFHTNGCLGCHKVSGVGGDEGTDLTHAGEKDPGQLSFAHLYGRRTVENWLAEHFRSPVSVVVGSQMPSLGLSDEKVDQLTMYVRSLRRRDLPDSFTPRDRIRATRLGEREFAANGGTLFGAFCTGCHGGGGVGRRSPGMPSFPAIARPDFLERVSDEFLVENISKGRPGRRMPAWGSLTGGLRVEEIRQIVAYLREIGAAHKPDGKPARWIRGDAKVGKEMFAESCSGCHGPEGKGNEGPALNNPIFLATATDSYLAGTIGHGRQSTVMQGFSMPAPTHRTLEDEEIANLVAFLRTWERGKK
jgi:cytochrome c oxidase cbb3-type subunit 3